MPTRYLNHGSTKYIILCYAKTRGVKLFDYEDFAQFSLKRWERNRIVIYFADLVKINYLTELDGKYGITEDGKHALCFVAGRHSRANDRKMARANKRNGLLGWQIKSELDDDD